MHCVSHFVHNMIKNVSLWTIADESPSAPNHPGVQAVLPQILRFAHDNICFIKPKGLLC